MPYSQPELSFISSSLLNTPPIRPDLRTSNSFRPLRAETEILPFTNGSARIVSEAGECIVGVKAEVENFADQLEETVSKTARGRGGVEVGITAKAGSTGLKEEELFNLVGGWERTLEEGLREDGIEDRLGIGRGYGWKLYIDILLLTTPASNPITLLSLTTYLALRTTRLPNPVSEPNEDPLFNDDWDQSLPLFPEDSIRPPLALLVTLHGENSLIDPTAEEISVAEACYTVTVGGNGKVMGVKTVETSGHIVGDKLDTWLGGRGGVDRSRWFSGIRYAASCAREVRAALENLIAIEKAMES